MMSRPKPVVLCILDGWGVRNPASDNAIHLAHTPCMDNLYEHYPHSLLKTSGLDVGLPDGQMGNSEVGHMNIGSGRIMMQDLPRIDQAIKDRTLAVHPELSACISKLKAQGKGACHLLGLLSDGGVHAHIHHIISMAQLLAVEGIPVIVHAFLDGRDTPPQSAVTYVKQFEEATRAYPSIRLGTVSGRYYAMDRDKRWERVTLAYEAIIQGKGQHAAGALQAIEHAYQHAQYDEFIIPTVLGDYAGVSDNDALLMMNFRADRARELLEMCVDPHFKEVQRVRFPKWSEVLGMVEYSEHLRTWVKPLFSPMELNDILAEIISRAGLKQLHLAETEKYAHVTFFFNGGKEEPFEGESRILVPSPQVATYDLQPEMSALEVTEKLLEAIRQEQHDFIVVNYANTDMVGHSGNMDAAIKAVETVDQCIGRLFAAIEEKSGVLFVTADHGNAEQMHDDHTGMPHTAHTTGPVPFIMAGKVAKGRSLKDGRLCDIAPTILMVMDMDKPTSMTGASLLV